jgi:pimeloyl-ACP methyl ester carboxylesterase
MYGVAAERLPNINADVRIGVLDGAMSPRLVARSVLLLGITLAVMSAPASFAQDRGEPILTIDHYVSHISSIPAIAGQSVQLYVRERAQTSTVLQRRAIPGSVVLFVHGATLPSEVGFDLAYGEYSWMAYLAQAGFDVFAMNQTGYGPSTRPAAMDDPCNISPEEQAVLVPARLPAPCSPTYSFRLGSTTTDWEEIDQVVDYLRTLRQIDRISLIAWSAGGPRAGGYAAQHPEKVGSLVLLAPGGQYSRSAQFDAPVPQAGVPMTARPREALEGFWDLQVNCEDQFDPAVRDTVWAQVTRSDPTASAWGPGMWRAPLSSPGGWTAALAAKVQAPTLLIYGEFDRGGSGIAVTGDNTRNLFSDLGTTNKVFLEMACTSHYAIWETRSPILHQASLDWLLHGSIGGMQRGSLRLGD